MFALAMHGQHDRIGSMTAPTLTERQKQVLEFLRGFVSAQGYPPTLREICAHFGISGPKNAAKHLDSLEKKGFIRRSSGISRAIEVTGAPAKGTVSLPIAGSVKAGPPHLAVEDITGRVTLDARFFNCPDGFILRIEGDSMTGAGLDEGDHAIVRPAPDASNGEIIVALLDGEATVKRFFKKGNTIILKPENPRLDPIHITGDDNRDFRIIGKIAYVIKSIGRTP